MLGARPGKINITSSPRVDISRRLPERKPSPTPTSRSREPTPQAMPNMVRNERSLWAQRARKISPSVSDRVRMRRLSAYSRHQGAGSRGGAKKVRQEAQKRAGNCTEFARGASNHVYNRFA